MILTQHISPCKLQQHSRLENEALHVISSISLQRGDLFLHHTLCVFWFQILLIFQFFSSWLISATGTACGGDWSSEIEDLLVFKRSDAYYKIKKVTVWEMSFLTLQTAGVALARLILEWCNFLFIKQQQLMHLISYYRCEELLKSYFREDELMSLLHENTDRVHLSLTW